MKPTIGVSRLPSLETLPLFHSVAGRLGSAGTAQVVRKSQSHHVRRASRLSHVSRLVESVGTPNRRRIALELVQADQRRTRMKRVQLMVLRSSISYPVAAF
jgi:hypothetical protein